MKTATTVVLLTALTMSGCAGTRTEPTPETTEVPARHVKMIGNSDPDAQARFEAARAAEDARLEVERAAQRAAEVKQVEKRMAEAQAQRDVWLALPDTQRYVKELCAMPEGANRDSELAHAKKTYQLIPVQNAEEARQARSMGFSVLDCS